MSFATPVFLWYFLPTVLVVYWILPARFRNYVLAATSLLFYAWGGGAFVFLLIGCILVNFAAGIIVGEPERPKRIRRAGMIVAVVFDVGTLVVWKYADFASRQVHHLAQVLGSGSTPVLQLALPIGISFFTFHHLSYVIDVYRTERRPQRNLVQFITYIALFPQLIAGPIVRYHEIADQLPEVRKDRWADLAAGFPRFALGLAKKVVVADTVATVADAGFTDTAHVTTATAWIGVLAYTIQIYFDFSGYSDMAIGIARMFGLRLPENFARPYSAVSITDFWRRWHMSLSRWFRDYCYIALGGNRKGVQRTYANLLTIFVLTGFWHGAAWTFLVWGLFHGALLVIERATGFGRGEVRRFVAGRRALTFFLVVVSWVFFRAESIGDAGRILRAMFIPTGSGLTAQIGVALTNQRILVLALALTVVFLPRSFVLGKVLDAGRSGWARVARIGTSWVMAPVAAVLVTVGTYSPFLYFKF